jgi:hypothetical protein
MSAGMYEAMREFIRVTVALEVQRAMTGAPIGAVLEAKTIERGQQGEPGPVGPQGPAGDRGLPGQDGRDGTDGIGLKAAVVDANGDLTITLSDGSRIFAGCVKGARGEKGDSGEPGLAGPPGPAGPMGPSGASGQDGQRGEKGERGEPGPAGERGAKGETGEPGRDGRNGRDGVDGKDGKDGIASRDEIRAEIAKAIAEAVPGAVELQVSTEIAKRPDLRYCGVWKDGGDYRAGNMATYAGSLWHCNQSGTTARPGDGSEEWTLVAKKGRDAK